MKYSSESVPTSPYLDLEEHYKEGLGWLRGQGSWLRLGREVSLPSLSTTRVTQPRQPAVPREVALADVELIRHVVQLEQTSPRPEKDCTRCRARNSSHKCGEVMWHKWLLAFD